MVQADASEPTLRSELVTSEFGKKDAEAPNWEGPERLIWYNIKA